jgi:hypothetical protein
MAEALPLLLVFKAAFYAGIFGGELLPQCSVLSVQPEQQPKPQ